MCAQEARHASDLEGQARSVSTLGGDSTSPRAYKNQRSSCNGHGVGMVDRTICGFKLGDEGNVCWRTTNWASHFYRVSNLKSGRTTHALPYYASNAGRNCSQARMKDDRRRTGIRSPSHDPLYVAVTTSLQGYLEQMTGMVVEQGMPELASLLSPTSRVFIHDQCRF